MQYVQVDVARMLLRVNTLHELSELALDCARKGEGDLNIENNDGFDTVTELGTARGELVDLLESISRELDAVAEDLRKFTVEIMGVDLDGASEIRLAEGDTRLPE